MFQQFGNIATYLTYIIREVDVNFCKQVLVTSTKCAIRDLINLNILHQNVTEPVQPAECLVGTDGDGGESHTEVHTVDEVTVAADAAGADNLTDLPSL